jgi:Fe-S cluster assembly scaffold protein SufB
MDMILGYADLLSVGRTKFSGVDENVDVQVVTDSKCLLTITGNLQLKLSVTKKSCFDIVILSIGHEDNESNLEIELQEASQLKCMILSCGCKKLKLSIVTKLNGANARSDINGFFHGQDCEKYIFSASQMHNVANSTSSVISKTVLDNSSGFEFYGTTNMAACAKDSCAQQTNNNILFSENASAISCPNLIILNNDVQCSHGVTVGSVDVDILFYMMSRGINLQTCKCLLTEGAMLSVIPLESFSNQVEKEEKAE